MLDGLIDAVRRGESRALVVRGEAGIGKSALLEYLVGAASDLTVVRATGVESDMELAFASLHQLCTPMLDRLDRLPDPQREALEVAFGISYGSAPDRFLVGLAVLSLLTEVAAERPLLCVVDDAQWLDRGSALTLAFAARRLFAERVGLVFGTRVVGEELRGFPDLEVRGLRDADARALLDSAPGFLLDEGVRDRIVAETRGNPLALLELPRELTAAQLAGGFGLPGAQALPGRIEESFVRRLAKLPEEAQKLLLIAAAEPVGDPLLVWRAAERLGIATAGMGIDTDGLVTLGERVTFRHPLVRSAVYGSSPAEERRAAHLALAEVTDRRLDPDRRAWHLAEAAAGPDEEVARELEQSAGRAQARGGLAAAAAFLRRSVTLTADPARRVDRALAAAQASLEAGDFGAALEPLATAEASAVEELQHALVELLRGQIAFASGRGGDAPPLLLEAARRLEPHDLDLAHQTYLDALLASIFAGRFARAGLTHEIARAALASPSLPEPRRPSDVMLEGLALSITESMAAAVPMLSRAARAFAEEEIGTEEGLRWSWAAPFAAATLWDEESWHAIAAKPLRFVREAGLLRHLPIYLNSMGRNAAERGDFTTARSLASETDASLNATGARLAPTAGVLLAAMRGNAPDALALIEIVSRDAQAAQQGASIQWCQWVSAILYNGLGEYAKALTEADQAVEPAPEVFFSIATLPELIEAATRTGQTARAAKALERLVASTSVSNTDWGLGIEARSRALIADGDEAERSYKEAIERLGRTHFRPELARAHLLYGEWLRRERRRVDAREQLRTAYAMLTEIGMEAFAERARGELVATGENVRKGTAETSGDLTARETRIAWLANEGLSNQEIGARLFISPRTVEWHLGKVFGKLGISSRSQLGRSSLLAEYASEATLEQGR